MSRKAKSLEELETRIGHPFADKAILERALTHISAASPRQGRGGSYQRLEFLGDHVLGLAVSDMLYRAFPKADEGELSRRLADLVRRDTCAEVARAIDLGAALKLGNSESNAGGRKRTATLADVCEALIGAVFIDGGYPAAAALIERLWRERMLKPPAQLRDAKTMLQEWAQGRGLPAPIYREVERTGPHHNPKFRVAVDISDKLPAEGHGTSKRAAEQAAAAAMLTREGVTMDAANG
jgi:ribonuclease III